MFGSRVSARVARGFASAVVVDRYRPLMANFIIIRRCNLACAYCVEYDDHSPPSRSGSSRSDSTTSRGCAPCWWR